MKSFKHVTIKDVSVSNVTCNVCGEDIRRNKLGYIEDYLCIEKTWGFGSEFDGVNHSIDICQECYRELFDDLKIKP